MSELHEALQYLGPAEWATFPQDPSELEHYLKELFTNVETIIDSVPIPTPDEAAQNPVPRVQRHARNASEVTLSAERPLPPPAEHEKLQKQWGKPLKIKPQENALGLSVYKMSGKDSRGSWFARHSIHEGIGFARFKRSMELEFEKSLAEPGPPGTGNVRGIGGEERVEQIQAGPGKVEVFRLSAQFPGPTAARDFVTMLITSDKAMTHDENAHGQLAPRHFMVVSRPCNHPKTQPQSGFVRGYYESIEFIREVPRKLKHTQSSLDLGGTLSPKEDSRPRSATVLPAVSSANQIDQPASSKPDPTDPEDNPVEWIMITRSDPGGGIPRFLVERGTPSSICGDAVKFLDWACQNDEDFQIHAKQGQQESALQRRESYQSWKGKSLAGLQEQDGSTERFPNLEESPASPVEAERPTSNGGMMSTVTGAAAVLRPYTPQVILDHLPGADTNESPQPRPTMHTDSGLSPAAQADDSISVTTFASAEDHWTSSSSEDGVEADSLDSLKSTTDLTDSKEQLPQEKELRKIQERRNTLQKKFAAQQSKLQATHAKQAHDSAEQTQKAVEKHEKELKKHEEKFKRELDKLERKQDRERKKAAEKARKQADKNELARYKRERDEAKQELELSKKELESLHAIVVDLQKQNTSLAMRLGRAGIAIGPDQPRSRGSSESRKVNEGGRDILAQSAAASVKSDNSVKSQ